MGNIYNITRTSTALSTTNDYLSIIGATNRAFKIKWISVVGMGTASAANEILLQRTTGGTTGGGAITPSPMMVQQAAAAMAVWTTWSAQPTPSTVLDRLPVNANGGNTFRWYPPGTEPEFRGTEQVGLRSASGTSSVTVTVCVEEF